MSARAIAKAITKWPKTSLRWAGKPRRVYVRETGFDICTYSKCR